MMRLEGRMVSGSEGNGCCIASLEERERAGSELSWNSRRKDKEYVTATWKNVLRSWSDRQDVSCNATR